jgi:ubiquinone/menaquinone biosynthesis C-methylase UbiE
MSAERPSARFRLPRQRFPLAVRLWFNGLDTRAREPELLDTGEYDPAELMANLCDIRRANRFFGGISTALDLLPELIGDRPVSESVTILDLATGSADIPLAVCDWARTSGRAITIVASDLSSDILDIAEIRTAGEPHIRTALFDARRIPMRDRSVDIVLCSLALHHFEDPDAVRVLSEMDRLSKAGFIVNDLRRSRIALLGAWLAGRLFTRNRLTRHDAPLSVRRAFTPAELSQLLARAGIEDAVVMKRPWFRMAAIKYANRTDGTSE